MKTHCLGCNNENQLMRLFRFLDTVFSNMISLFQRDMKFISPVSFPTKLDHDVLIINNPVTFKGMHQISKKKYVYFYTLVSIKNTPTDQMKISSDSAAMSFY